MQFIWFSLKICDHIKKCDSEKTLRETQKYRWKYKKAEGDTGEGDSAVRRKKGQLERRGRSEPESHFRSVWSADALAHSSTLESREGGGRVRKKADEI